MTDDFETRVRWSPYEWEIAASTEPEPERAEYQRTIAAHLRLRGAASFLELWPNALPTGLAEVDAETQARVDIMRWDAEMRIDEADKAALRQAANAERDRLGIPRIPRTSLED